VEWLYHLLVLSLQLDENMMRAFQHFDTDNSGTISKEELKEALKVGPSLPARPTACDILGLPCLMAAAGLTPCRYAGQSCIDALGQLLLFSSMTSGDTPAGFTGLYGSRVSCGALMGFQHLSKIFELANRRPCL
jgi:hypothetical protein